MEEGGKGKREEGRGERGSDGEGKGDEYTYRANLTLSTHLEVIEGKNKMKEFPQTAL